MVWCRDIEVGRRRVIGIRGAGETGISVVDVLSVDREMKDEICIQSGNQ